MTETGRALMVVGLTQTRGHCTFTWQEPLAGGRREVEVGPEHCLDCVAELRARGYRVRFADAAVAPPAAAAGPTGSATGGIAVPEVPPFRFHDAALITIALGRAAHDLRELRDRVAELPLGSLRHHFFEVLLRPSFDDPEFRNDFALWARDALRDDVLAERLAVIEPLDPPDGDGLRTALLEVLETRLAEVPRPPQAPPGHEFHFLRSQVVVFDTGLLAHSPEELAQRVRDLPRGSIFYHFVDARLRPPAGEDDFSRWLAAWGESGAAMRRRLARIDPLFDSLAELRDTLAEALAAAPEAGP